MHGETKVRYATGDLKKRITMRAYRTATPGIVIHRAVEPVAAGGWAITVESCGARLGTVHTEETAHAVAGAYGGLPIKWESIPEFTSPEDASKVVAVLRKRLASSPELLAWLHRIQTEGAAPN